MPRAKKDPNKPKGVKSAYIFFTEHERARREKETGVAPKFAELSKLCGPLWGEMTEEEKAPFAKLAEKDRKRHEKEMENYTPPSDDESDDDQPKKKKKKVKDPNAPKKNVSAYFHFAAATRPKLKAEDPDISITVQAKKIGALWNELSAEEKEPYEKLAEEDKERYNNEMAQYIKK